MSFDFRLGGPMPPLDTWGLVGFNGIDIPLFSLSLSFNGEFRVSNGNSPRLLVFSPSPLTWYHVEVHGAFDTATYSGTVTPFGGASFAWNNAAFNTSTPQYMNLGRIDIGDGGGFAINSPLNLDNFSIVPVPEPSMWLLAAVGALAGGCRVWRKRATRGGSQSNG